MIVKAPSWGPFKRPTCVLTVDPTPSGQVCLPKAPPLSFCVTPEPKNIIFPTQIPELNLYGPKTMRPAGSRSMGTEISLMANIVMAVNGMSGQLTG